MTGFEISRRAIGAGVIGAAALTAMRQAVAQTARGGGNWMDMVQAHHALIAQTFDQILATRDGDSVGRTELHRKLTYYLTAHAVAEENVLYPALAILGLRGGSDHLYIEQAHAKVGNADLEMSPNAGPDWIRKVVRLHGAVLHHAKVEEEAELFPRLLYTAGPRLNDRLTYAYAREFGRVQRL